jgi:signal transduction histidine kinase/PAS domain-containing protein
MNATCPPLPSHEPPRGQATTPGEAESRVPPPSGHTRKPWPGLMRWIQENTFAPEWLPDQLRHPLIGYLVAALVELTAVSAILLLLTLVPDFDFYAIFTLVGVIVMAVGWGAGPSLFATLVSMLVLYLVVFSPRFSWVISDPADGIGLLVYLMVGVSISLLAGRSERARRHAEEAAQLLAQAEARSRFEAERLSTVLEVLPSAVLIASNQGQLLAMNQATKTLWGGDIALGTDIMQYSRQNQFTAWRAGTGQELAPEEWPLARTLTSGKAVLNDELEIETQDGQRKVILNSAAPMRDETGAITGAVSSAQDISDLRRLEREVAERAQELEAIFETMTDGVFVYDAQRNLTHLNARAREILGPEAHPQDRPMEERAARRPPLDEDGQPLPFEQIPSVRILEGEVLTGAQAVDIYLPTPEGRTQVLSVSGTTVRTVDGAITGAIVMTRDVTERHRLERRARETLDALVAMAEAMVQVRPTTPAGELKEEPPSAIITDATMPLEARRLAELTCSVVGCRRVSIAAVDASTGQLDPVTEVGLSHEQEQAWWAGWSPAQSLEERYGTTVAAALRAGEPALLDAERLPESSWYTLYQAPSGQIVPMRLGEELVGILLVDYQDPDRDYSTGEEGLLTRTLARLGALVLERDRLLRHWAEARANELALTETKTQMDTFLGIAGHELRSPLTSLKLSLQISERRLRNLTQGKNGTVAGRAAELNAALEPVSRTAHQVERIESLVNDLVDVSRIQAGKLELRPNQTDLVTVVHEAVLEQQQAAGDRTILLRSPADLSVPVYADAGRIEQVMTNYLTNALKYSPADRPVEVGVEEEQQQARVWVRDQGPGLPLEEQEQIWERFHRAKGVEVLSGTGVGLGLGLYISRMIIERHQGQVGVQSAPGKGSTFWFTLPLSSP